MPRPIGARRAVPFYIRVAMFNCRSNIAFPEEELKKKTTAGGRRDQKVKLWFVPSGKIKGKELKEHIILDAASNRSITS
ncbi:MAG TPA: hypothetical protein VHN12_09455 [Geobacteraceae bacterium]|nr:hypothetical protein [Geobacteraceae bacterium]